MHPNSYSGSPCPYCQRLMDKRSFKLRPTRDHVIPSSRGGTVKIVCCNKCNSIKADMMPAAWATYMVQNPGWWTLSKAERRRRRRAIHDPTITWPARVRQRGSAPLPPVIVPPELIYTPEELS